MARTAAVRKTPTNVTVRADLVKRAKELGLNSTCTRTRAAALLLDVQSDVVARLDVHVVVPMIQRKKYSAKPVPAMSAEPYAATPRVLVPSRDEPPTRDVRRGLGEKL
jgi:hypothetical protein